MTRGRPRYEDVLTPREWEVLNLLEEGLTNEEIAARLGISFAGARYHVAEIISKLGVATRGEAAAWAREQGTNRRPWSSLALLVQRLRLGSPAGVASAGLVVAAVSVAALFAVLLGGGQTEPMDGPAFALDGMTAEEFIASLDRGKLLSESEVLYTRLEVYERHGPMSRELAGASGIDQERYVRESWQEAGPGGALVRAYGRVVGTDGDIIQVFATENGSSRTIDPRTGVMLWDKPVPVDSYLRSAPVIDLASVLDELASGVARVKEQSGSRLVLESVYDEAHFIRVFRDEQGFTEERTQLVIDSVLQRNQTPGNFGLPYYGDLSAEALLTLNTIEEDGSWRTERFVISTSGETIPVGSIHVTHYEIVDLIPPEVIALTR